MAVPEKQQLREARDPVSSGYAERERAPVTSGYGYVNLLQLLVDM